METLVSAVEKILAQEDPRLSQSKDVGSFEESIVELEKLGIIKKSSYDLPPTDTVGRRYYELTTHSYKRR